MTNNPILILWDPRFTPKHPFFRLSWNPEITKAKMAKDLIGIDLPEDAQGPGITLLVNERLGIVLHIATWEDFLKTASKKQVRNVLEFLEYSSQPNAHIKHIMIPEGSHSIL